MVQHHVDRWFNVVLHLRVVRCHVLFWKPNSEGGTGVVLGVYDCLSMCGVLSISSSLPEAPCVSELRSIYHGGACWQGADLLDKPSALLSD